MIDEVAAFLLVLFFAGVTPLRIAFAFVLFRFFDIVKPPPIRQLDAALKNGVGVMLDDIARGGLRACSCSPWASGCSDRERDMHAERSRLDLRRVEEVGLNALQTQRQLFYDGWLLRVSPGKARRARSVNAHFGSTLPLDREDRATASACTASADLPVLFRITPFVQPRGPRARRSPRAATRRSTPTLRAGGARSRVRRSRATCDGIDVVRAGHRRVRRCGRAAAGRHARAARRVSRAHGEHAADRRARCSRSATAAPVGVGTVMLEDGLAGVFSMATAPDMRAARRGDARCSRALLDVGVGARRARTRTCRSTAHNHAGACGVSQVRIRDRLHVPLLRARRARTTR